MKKGIILIDIPYKMIYCIFQMSGWTISDRSFVRIEPTRNPILPQARELYWKQSDGDCKLVIVSEDKTITCHRKVLAAYSPVFEKIFTSGMRESVTGTVQVHDFSADIIEAILRYRYICRNQILLLIKFHYKNQYISV